MPVISFSGKKIEDFELKLIENRIITKMSKLAPFMRDLQEIQCHFKPIHPSAEHTGKIETNLKLILKGRYHSFKKTGFSPKETVDQLLNHVERVFKDKKR